MIKSASAGKTGTTFFENILVMYFKINRNVIVFSIILPLKMYLKTHLTQYEMNKIRIKIFLGCYL